MSTYNYNNMNKHFLRVFVLLSLLAASACKNNKRGKEQPETETPASVTVPKFDRDSAYAFLASQLEFGPRVPNTPAHKACGEWLAQRFETYGAQVIRQDFSAKAYTGAMLQGMNIIAQYNPGEAKRIVLAAHWDSRHIADSPSNQTDRDKPVMGADDGGSGVAVLLEVARQLQQNPVGLGVDLVLFDLEDYGEDGGTDPNSWGMGSQYWSRNLHYRSGIRPQYGILLDMVGGKGARFGKEYFSLQYAAPVVDKVWSLATSMGYGNYFVQDQVGVVTDDHYFVNTIAGIPMIDIINRPPDTETGFPAHWHTPNDTLDAIDPFTLRAVGQLMLAVIYREFAGTL